MISWIWMEFWRKLKTFSLLINACHACISAGEAGEPEARGVPRLVRPLQVLLQQPALLRGRPSLPQRLRQALPLLLLQDDRELLAPAARRRPLLRGRATARPHNPLVHESGVLQASGGATQRPRCLRAVGLRAPEEQVSSSSRCWQAAAASGTVDLTCMPDARDISVPAVRRCLRKGSDCVLRILAHWLYIYMFSRWLFRRV